MKQVDETIQSAGAPDSECLYLFPLKKTGPLGEGVPSGSLTIIYR